MTIPYKDLKANEHYNHIGSRDINVSNLGDHSNFTSLGSRNVFIHGLIGLGVAINQIGSGDLSVANEVSKDASITITGSGNAYFAKSMSDNVSMDITGSGNLTIEGSIGDNFNLKILGSRNTHLNEIGREATILSLGCNNLIVAGKVGEGTRFNFQSQKLHFKSVLHDTVEFDGELCNEVWFDTPPSDAILNKIKSAQERALTSNVGFSTVNGCQIKSGSGWVRVKENGTDTLYTGNVFQIINGVKYMDGYRIQPPPVKTSHPILAKINRFADEHPGVFLLGTLGLGLLWYFGRWCSNFSLISNTNRFYENITRSCSRSEDPRAYYLADLSAANVKNNPAAIGNSNVLIASKLISIPGKVSQPVTHTHNNVTTAKTNPVIGIESLVNDDYTSTIQFK